LNIKERIIQVKWYTEDTAKIFEGTLWLNPKRDEQTAANITKSKLFQTKKVSMIEQGANFCQVNKKNEALKLIFSFNSTTHE